jgi:hypothetical protein
VTIERTEVPPFVREPNGPTLNEVLPFVQIGTGAGNEEAVASMADFVLDRAAQTAEIARFAKEAAQGKKGQEAIRAVYERVMASVKGADALLTARAAATLAQGRGSRLVLLKAALTSLGIQSRFALARPFTSDPASYRFPAVPEQYGYALLQVLGPDGELYLDPSIRFAPFGRLPEALAGQPAAIFPEPGEPVRFVVLPKAGEQDKKRVSLALRLDASGTLEGEAEEIFEGFDAAATREALEKMSPEQRKQVIESGAAQTFDGATLKSFAIEAQESSGAPVVLRYAFAAPLFGRPEGNRLVVHKPLFPAKLSRRYLTLSERSTPLLIPAAEQVELQVKLQAPEGMRLSGPMQPERIETPFGRFVRVEERAGAGLMLKETLSIPMTRIPADKYRAFGEMVAAIDRAQERELTFERAAEAALVR